MNGGNHAGEKGTGRPDPRAVEAAQAVLKPARPEAVVLFGSRARGDHGESPDMDLLIIVNEHLS